MKLVGSNLDLRKVSWKKQVDIIPSRLSTDSSSDEAPHLSHTHTPLPGEDRAIRATDRQAGGEHASCQFPSKATSVSPLPSLIRPYLRNHAEPTPTLQLAAILSFFPPASKDRWHQLPQARLMTSCFSRGLSLYFRFIPLGGQ